LADGCVAADTGTCLNQPRFRNSRSATEIIAASTGAALGDFVVGGQEFDRAALLGCDLGVDEIQYLINAIRVIVLRRKVSRGLFSRRKSPGRRFHGGSGPCLYGCSAKILLHFQ
jgi:hypothetical protein